MVTLEEIKRSVLNLPVPQRNELAEWLSHNVDEGDSEAEIMNDWLDLAEKRLRDFEDGKIQAIPMEEVLQRLRSGESLK